MLNKFALGIKLESGQTSINAFKLLSLTLPLFSVFEQLEQLYFNTVCIHSTYSHVVILSTITFWQQGDIANQR